MPHSPKTIIPTAVLAMGVIGALAPATAMSGEPAFNHQLAQLSKHAESDASPGEPKPAKDEKAAPSTPAPTPGLDLSGDQTDPGAVIDGFRVPIFLLPIYQAAGTEYGIRWEVLAAINEIETDYGRNLSVSSAGAEGWMQFMPATWRTYGLDANQDGKKDPYNPVDAIFAAARYLDAAGYADDPRTAIFAYNHADWYVDDVVERARRLAQVPAEVISSLTGLTDGRFPVEGRARYAGVGKRSARIQARPGAAVVAVADGEITKVGKGRGGYHLVLRDSYGNRYAYQGLGSLQPWHREAEAEPIPTGKQEETGKMRLRAAGKQRLYANPSRAGTREAHAQAVAPEPGTGGKPRKERRMKPGTRVSAGTLLGHVADERNAHITFEVRPAGGGAPAIDPVPILDGWRLLDRSEVYRADGSAVLKRGSGVGAVLQMSKPQLERRVLADDRIEIYEAGRVDIEAGAIDRRVLATLAYLAESGLSPTVTSLRSGHSRLTSSGNVSYHWSGNAVDISSVNGTPVLGHQEPRGVADQVVRRVLQLQGAMRPAEVISLLDYGGPSFAMADHDDHVHVGFAPAPGVIGLGKARAAKVDAHTWDELSLRLEEIDQPTLKKSKGKDAKGGRKGTPRKGRGD